MRIHSQKPLNQHKSGNIRALLLLGVYSVVFIAVCSLACRPKPGVKEPNAAAQVTPKSTETPSGDSAAVTVNGVKITQAELDKQSDLRFKRVAARGASLPPAFLEQARKQFRQQTLEDLIVERLLDEKVKEAKIEVTDDDVTRQLEKIGSSQNPPLTVEDFKIRVEAQGGNFNDVKKQLKQGMSYQKLMEVQWANLPPVTEEEAKKFYTDNEKQFQVPEQIRASHILINIDPNADDPNAAKAKAKVKAEDLLKKIKDGADFAELAKANSDCPSKAKGGDLDFFTKGQMVAPFENAAFALKPGELSDIVETSYGYHIIKVTDHKDAGQTPFEQAKASLIEQLTEVKRSEAAQKYIESLKSKAKIVYAPGLEPKPQSPAPVSTGATKTQ